MRCKRHPEHKLFLTDEGSYICKQCFKSASVGHVVEIEYEKEPEKKYIVRIGKKVSEDINYTVTSCQNSMRDVVL